MLHTFSLNSLPKISSIYRIERQTLWQTCDKENIAVLMVSGRCLFSIGTKSYPASAGQMVFIPAGQDYQRQPLDDRPATFYYFHFALEQPPQAHSAQELLKTCTEQQAKLYLTSEPSRQNMDIFVCLDTVVSLPETARTLAAQALDEYISGRMESRLAYTLLFGQILSLATQETLSALRTATDSAAEYQLPQRLSEAIVYIRQNHTRPLTVGEVCVHAGISRQHMIRLFRAELGMTPIQYINHTKIMRAKDLLWRDNTLTVKELAYELGFSDEHYFTRVFTKIVGQSPKAFRTHVRAFSSDAGTPK